MALRAHTSTWICSSCPWLERRARGEKPNQKEQGVPDYYYNLHARVKSKDIVNLTLSNCGATPRQTHQGLSLLSWTPSSPLKDCCGLQNHMIELPVDDVPYSGVFGAGLIRKGDWGLFESSLKGYFEPIEQTRGGVVRLKFYSI